VNVKDNTVEYAISDLVSEYLVLLDVHNRVDYSQFFFGLSSNGLLNYGLFLLAPVRRRLL